MRRALLMVCFFGVAPAAGAADVVARHPGLMCSSAAALARLTVPGGDSRTHRAGVSAADLNVARQGGCVDIVIGSRANVVRTLRNTTIVSYPAGSDTPSILVVPNVDFETVGAPGGATAEVAGGTGAGAGMGATATGPGGDAESDATAARSIETLLHAPRLTDIATALAYAKMTGTTPDFRAYGEHAAVYQQASTFQKDEVLQHLVAGYRAEFASLNLSRIYSLLISVPLNQYDPGRGGYAVDFDDNHFMPMTDPATQFQNLHVSFSNIGDFNFVPMGSEAAQDFAAKYGFDTHYQQAGSVVLQLAFRLVDAPPAVDTQTSLIRAHVLAARILTTQGQVLHTFAPDAAALAAPAGDQSGSMVSQVPALKSASVEGIAVGMSHAAALEAAHTAFASAHATETATSDAYFNNLKAGFQPSCGTVGGSMPPFGMFGQQEEQGPGQFSDCLAFDIAAERITAVHSVQFLSGTSRATVLEALKSKFGPPTYVARGGEEEDDKWIGRDPTGSVIEIDGTVTADGQVTKLQVDAHAWKDPHPKVEKPPTEAGPKL